ncbi:hypothetical protein SAMN05446037_100441 [Anaerovirgula multivorans]|uniref:Uncharacterized protein n=2 Tax=Anaerovirgula multivorans TaxID=312168 RepID=A0A239BR29_9FIRM|nr:hypothetical protein SAMN05446037_100441 [Anaerovirgula multivorans]
MNMLFRKNTDIEVDEKIIKKNRVPVLIKDKEWKNIIASSHTNKTIQFFSKQLEDLINEEKESLRQLNNNKQYKTKLMNKIIYLSDLLNRQGKEDVLPELEKCKEEITKVNEIIDEIMDKTQDYSREIERVNLALLKETIVIVYKDITIGHDKLLAVDQEIEELREKLGNLRDEKDELEKKNEKLYSFLHTVIGHKEMEKLDVLFLEE